MGDYLFPAFDFPDHIPAYSAHTFLLPQHTDRSHTHPDLEDTYTVFLV